MQAIIPNRPARSRPYAWGCISVNPDPPSVGGMTTLTFPLANPGPDEVIVERIDARVALFGMGVQWEHLPSAGPFHLPPDPRHVEQAAIEWVPRVGGHRCVRATIRVKGMEEVCEVGRNLHVIEAAAEEEFWRVPFRLGNPERHRAPILLRFGGNDAPAIDVLVRVGEQVVPLDRPIMLRPEEDVQAEMLLRARTDAALHHIRTVEALIEGRMLDGIQVTVCRPARFGLGALGDAPIPQALHELAYAAVH